MQDWVSGLHLFSRTQMILTTEFCFSKFLWIHGVLLYPLNYEEAESSSKAEDDQKQELPRQQKVAAVEERHCCTHRLTGNINFIVGYEKKELQALQHLICSHVCPTVEHVTWVVFELPLVVLRRNFGINYKVNMYKLAVTKWTTVH